MKDGFNDYIVHGRRDAVNPEKTGTKAAGALRAHRGRGRSRTVVRLRLARHAWRDGSDGAFGSEFDDVMTGAPAARPTSSTRTVIPSSLDADAANVMRQALAGMLWSKQFYNYDVDRWLAGARRRSVQTARDARAPRNDRWHHMHNADIISMPDKWEYPWYAAWDLAFHVLALTLVDPDFGKQQLDLMLRERYLHPSGQIPAYEWNFGDVNPPVHAWATIFTYRLEKQPNRRRATSNGSSARFHKLLLNFTWWVNRKDRTGNNVFEGGFLGLDNIGVFDRSAPLPTGGYLEQADGTAWMALFCQNMLEIAAELAQHEPPTPTWRSSSSSTSCGSRRRWSMPATTSACGTRRTASSTTCCGCPTARAQRLKVRSMVGLLPLCAVTVFDGDLLKKHPELVERMRAFLEARPELTAFIHDPAQTRASRAACWRGSRRSESCGACWSEMLDENEFLSPYGIRSISRYHAGAPVRLPRGRPGVPRLVPAGGVRQRACSAATRTGAGRSGCRSTA